MLVNLLKKLLRVLFSKYVLRSLGILIFCGILWMVDLRKVWHVLSNSKITEIAVGSVMIFPISYVRAVRWNIIKRKLGIRVPYSLSFFYQLIAQMAFFTPGKIGEFIKAVYLKGKNYSLTSGGISIVGDRIFDLLTVTLVAAGASVYFFQDLVEKNLTSVMLLALVGLLIAGIILQNRKRLFEFFRIVVMFFVPGAFQKRVGRFIDNLKNHLSDYSGSWIGNLFLISFIAFALQVLRIQLFALAIGISVSFLQLAGIIALMSLSNLLPITFLGLSTRDAIFLYFFGLLGVPPEKAISLSIIIFSFIIIIGGVAALVFTIFPPKIKVSSILKSET